MFKVCLCFLAGFTVTLIPQLGWSDEATSFEDQVATIVEQGINEGEMPGAVVVVADQKQVLYQRAFGDRQVEPHRVPMTLNTVFDLASLTKPIATATSVMCLVQAGKVEVDEPVCRYLPEFTGHGKESITVSDLLLHVGGLIPDNALADYQQGPEEAWKRICELKPIAARGEKFAYTDVGFIVLGKLVERVSGRTLDRFAFEEIFQPLEMKETMYLPGDDLQARAAPTERRDGHWMQGEVHDPRAYLLGGVAGHAGLFSTAGDLVRYGQMMLARGKAAPSVLDTTTLQTMTRPREVPRGTRTFGWDHRSPYSSNRGEAFSDSAFGHGGFTGTVIWIDPDQDRVFVFLSNRLHPDGKGTVNRLAGKIATLIGQEAGE
jgi:CubicO group peptidase (beta-lactamase class C family)